jgi:predicted ArsR family transcriptional regulator
MSLIDRLLDTLYNTNSVTDRRKTLSTKQAAARFHVPAHSVRARVSDLRRYGHNITVDQRRTTAGRTQSVYSIGA